MCNPKENILFCTCENLESRDRVWTLYKKDQSNAIGMDGLLMEPMVDIEEEKQWRDSLLHSLNSGRAFDFEYTPKKEDRLAVTIPIKDSTDLAMQFGFEYTGTAWNEIEFNPFDWSVKYIEMGEGCLGV
jgi:hypothetical protein